MGIETKIGKQTDFCGMRLVKAQPEQKVNQLGIKIICTKCDLTEKYVIEPAPRSLVEFFNAQTKIDELCPEKKQVKKNTLLIPNNRPKGLWKKR